jgi:hypothetical protein
MTRKFFVRKSFAIELTVKLLVYGCMISVLALSVTLLLGKLDLQSVKPLAQSTVFVLIGALLYGMGRKTPRPGVAIRASGGPSAS